MATATKQLIRLSSEAYLHSVTQIVLQHSTPAAKDKVDLLDARLIECGLMNDAPRIAGPLSADEKARIEAEFKNRHKNA